MKPFHPVLSIILPTKNRSHYAVSTIRGILAWQADDFELVVQDNGDDDLAGQLGSDPRLRYHHCSTPLDMEANFTQGVLNSRGEYVALIGDDDGVTEEAVEVARWGSVRGFQAVFASGLAQFLWPDVVSPLYGRRFSGVLRIAPFDNRISYPDGESEIRKCVKSAGSNFHSLPRVYFGIVRRDCLDVVREKCGRFFPGPTPDLAGAIAVAAIAERIVEVNYPIFVHGTGRRSVGGLGVAKRHIGRLEDWPHLPQWSVKGWSSWVPRLFLGQTIWAEDVVQATRAAGRGDLLREFNIPLLHALCLCSHPAHSPEIMESFHRQMQLPETPRVAWWIQFAMGYLYGWAQRVGSLIGNLATLASLGPDTMIKEIKDSEAAMGALAAHLRKNDLSFIRCVGTEPSR